MNKAIAVFDAGLGSYAIVEAIKKAYPQQDIIYLCIFLKYYFKRFILKILKRCKNE